MKTVIRFTASWCGPCKVYAPTFEKVASQTPGVEFQTIDVDSNDPRIIEYGVRGIPTTVIIENNGTPKRISGNLSENQLKDFIK
jgi:thiol-disulfide isomerase/thioredoxin